MDYEELATTGKRYHKLYVDDGNKMKFYKTNTQKGKVSLVNEEEQYGQIE